MKKNIYTLLALSLFIPVISFAAPLGGVKSLVVEAGKIVSMFVPVLFGLAVLYFFWGLAQFVLHSGEEDALKEGKQKMLWGIIALFVFISIFGILKFIGDAVGISSGGFINSTGGIDTGTGYCNGGVSTVDGSPCN